MNVSEIRKCLGEGGPVIGAWMTQSSPLICEAMISCGFDWVALDCEHGVIDLEQISTLVQIADGMGIAPLVRLPSADPYFARRALDAGAQGVLVPVVESAQTFADFCAHLFYPPKGTRGFGLGRFNQWGDTLKEYTETFAPVIVPMIETRKGIANAEAIAGLDMVDAVFLGPYDLSADLGDPGNFQSAAYKDAVSEIVAACKRAGTPMGGHQVGPDIEVLRERIAEGFQFIAYGTDILAVRESFAGLAKMRAGDAE